ncbi:MAG: hypothetical protein ACRERC_15960 [Candidatus Binatia bacterium]
MKAWVFVAASILLSIPSRADDQCPDEGKGWSSVAPGVCRVQLAANASTPRVDGYRFDPEKYEIRVSDSVGFFETRSEPAKQGASASVFKSYVFSLDEAYEILGQPASILAAIGYPLFPGDPVNRGLLRINGTNKSDLAKSEDERKYLTALLCFHNAEARRPGVGKVTVPLLVPQVATGLGPKCDNAIQVGPRIVEPSFSRGIKDTKPSRRQENRTTFSIGRDNHFYILFWESASLFGVQEALLTNQLSSAAAPQWAVNISLRQFAGIKSASVSFGETSSTISGLLVVQPRASDP